MAVVQQLRPEVVAVVVEALEGLLERAKAGEIVAMAYTVDVKTGFNSDIIGVMRDRFSMLGGVTRLAYYLNQRIDSDPEHIHKGE